MFSNSCTPCLAEHVSARSSSVCLCTLVFSYLLIFETFFGAFHAMKSVCVCVSGCKIHRLAVFLPRLLIFLHRIWQCLKNFYWTSFNLQIWTSGLPTLTLDVEDFSSTDTYVHSNSGCHIDNYTWAQLAWQHDRGSWSAGASQAAVTNLKGVGKANLKMMQRTSVLAS